MNTTLPNGITYNIRRMQDNTDEGYGPSYVSDNGAEEGTYWIFWDESTYWNYAFAIRCSTLEEAYEHAVICMTEPIEVSDLSIEDLAEIELSGSAAGYTTVENGSIRCTESLKLLRSDVVFKTNER